MAANPHSTIPCIGASGGISGVIVFYALSYPHAQLSLLLRFWWVQIPAWGALALWVALQVWNSLAYLSGFSKVAGLAHLGGAAAGLVIWREWRKMQ